MVAPAVTCGSTRLPRWIAPVRKRPSGTTTWPPPARWQAAMAARNAAVFIVRPSPTAPWSVILKLRRGQVAAQMAGAGTGATVIEPRPVVRASS